MSGASENDLPQAGDTIATKYRVEEVLGRGGMGAVFRVTHAVTGKSFAVKWLLPQLNAGAETAQRFIREAQVAGRVDHPNVVQVYDIGEDRGSMYMVMEMLQGESLAQHLARVGRVPHAQACQLLIGVARGLAAAHRSGVIHRDLKPDNIFLSVSSLGQPRPKILDFGISKISALATEANPALTREGVVMGTPHYMAPEQLRSHKLDGRCDIYALGVILYQMLSGKLPFEGDNLPDLMLKIISETPPSLAKRALDAPAELIAITERAMARSAAERFETVADFGRALEPFSEGASFDVQQPSSIRPPSSIVTGPSTPVATESRFPLTDGQAMGVLQRTRRFAVPVAVSLASAALASWLYVSFDNQQAAHGTAAQVQLPHAMSTPAAIDKPEHELRVKDAAKHTPPPDTMSQAQLQLVAPKVADKELDELPEPHVRPLRPEGGPRAEDLEQQPSLIGAISPQVTLAAGQELPREGAEREGGSEYPSPMPPPGAATPAKRTDNLGSSGPASPAFNEAATTPVPSKLKPRMSSTKKPATKYESPEIRINDFFK